MDLSAVLLSPTIFLVTLPDIADHLIDALVSLARETKDAGWICSSAAFDMHDMDTTTSEMREFVSRPREAAKMEQSILHFKVANPEWQPANKEAAAFLDDIHQFVDTRREREFPQRDDTSEQSDSEPSSSPKQPIATAPPWRRTHVTQTAERLTAQSPESDPLKLTDAGRGILDLLEQVSFLLIFLSQIGKQRNE